MARRRETLSFGLSFLDAMTCGLGAVILLYMIINAAVGVRSGRQTADLSTLVERLEEEVLTSQSHLVDLERELHGLEAEEASARGLSERLLEILEKLEEELADHEASTLAQREHLDRLKTDLETLEEETRRLAAAAPDVDETPGDRIRAFRGDGDRQYLTGLKLGGRRILILVDTSASLLADTLVNILIRRNLPDAEKRRAEKWQQAVASVDWLTTQLPRDAQVQIYGFAEEVTPFVEGSLGQWLEAGDRVVLEQAITELRATVPDGGTNLYRALAAAKGLRPAPDNILLLTDGLPTQGRQPPRRGTVDGKQRLRLFEEAKSQVSFSIPINIILLPMEGDPDAASAFWRLAIETRGSFLAPARDWP